MQSITSHVKNQATAKPATPYESIDPEVRRLVRPISERPGLHTIWSCAGHALGEEAYVSFTAEVRLIQYLFGGNTRAGP